MSISTEEFNNSPEDKNFVYTGFVYAMYLTHHPSALLLHCLCRNVGTCDCGKQGVSICFKDGILKCMCSDHLAMMRLELAFKRITTSETNNLDYDLSEHMESLAGRNIDTFTWTEGGMHLVANDISYRFADMDPNFRGARITSIDINGYSKLERLCLNTNSGSFLFRGLW